MFGTRIENQDLVDQKKLGFYQKMINYVFSPMHLGQLTIVLPSGEELVYGDGKENVRAEIRIINNDFFKKCVFFGDVGFGESYVDGDWETDNITQVIEWMILNVENHPTLMSDRVKNSAVNVLKFFNNILKPFAKNSIEGSHRNISAHYDLSNHFYKLFLDPSMAYSSAYFKHKDVTLEEAQYAKFDKLCQKLRLQATDHVLEIGSGWGGFAIHAVKNYGCRVTTITVSKEQHEYAKQYINDLGLSDKIDVKLVDYRKVGGIFDKIVSIEMLEAVGHEYLEPYFKQCHRLLKKDGLLALQVILSPDHRYDSFRKNMDWIQKHIFPGSLLPSVGALQNAVNQTGDLCLHDFEDMTMHYVKTLQVWHENFNARIDDVKALGFADDFIRKWNYYLCYCEAAFHMRNISVAQLVFTRPNNLKLATER